MTVVPEAQLQTYVLNLTRDAFAHLPAESFRVEKHFTLRFGHNLHDHDGTLYWEAQGRADLLVFHQERPLALFELKREDMVLKEQDFQQGQSYTAALFPRPPLIIVSNGKDTWVRQTDDGAELPTDADAEVIEKIFANVGKLAAANNSWAIEVLMGPETHVWVEAVRLHTEELVERQSGDPSDLRKPFARGILFQRRTTAAVAARLEAGARAIIIEGPPLAGKSNVLRDFAVSTRRSRDWAMLMVNGATASTGLFQRLANVLGQALEWKLSADDVRTWLRRMSHSTRSPALVLVVDGLRSGSAVAQDFEELAESGFGPGLRLVGATDRAGDVLRDTTGRGDTALAAIAEVVTVEPLDDGEFIALTDQLGERRILFYPGAELAAEYRRPWLLRAVLANGASPERQDVVSFIPATMGLALVHAARARFKDYVEVARDHRLLARDALNDDEVPDAALALASANAFVIRRDALSAGGESAAVRLEAQGWITFYRHPVGEDVIGFRVPDLFISELAFELAALIDKAISEKPEDAWRLLVGQAKRFFLGDLVGAQALVDLGQKRHGLPESLIGQLMNDRPECESIAGKTIGLQMADGTIANFRFNEHHEIAQIDAQGNQIGPYTPLDDDDAGTRLGNVTSWLILSQLSGVRTAYGETMRHRFDIDIMLWVGRASFPLIRGSEDVSMLKPRLTLSLDGDGSVLAQDHAMAEPLTSAMYALFAREWRDLDSFFERLAEDFSLPLTVRVHHALNALETSASPGLPAWAEEKIGSVIVPLLRRHGVEVG